MANQIHDQVPCLHCHPESFIRMVQHLIERCLLLNMSREDCIAALQEHANIDPIITITVWEELRKENSSFFESYDSQRQKWYTFGQRSVQFYKLIKNKSK
ncbi:hypothetical protein DCAR_0312710 [Daucus carota subsp. sativus]|uniref:Uncharacterized protein n=1 Tax=Daucus carota subsp. sativus TaxID=79200 RepID=A0AAF0WQC3_DAUCS|nr:hypothetical protein DCAR_0312710 [Daucus carota subsp. sativus]